MATLNQEIIAALSHLVRLNEASELGFETAAEHAREPGVKYVLREFARQRAASATELRAEIELWGGAAMEQPDPMAALHRGWIDLKAGLTLGRDNIARVVLDECVRGENVALRRYQQAQQELLPETVQTLIQQHVVRRQADYDKLCRMAACGDEALLIRLYRNGQDAEAAIQRLAASDIPPEQVEVTAIDDDSMYVCSCQRQRVLECTSAGALSGAALGGIFGLIVGFALLLVGGWNSALALGGAMAISAGVALVFGALLGLIIGLGVTGDDAYVYEESVRDGGTLVSITLPRRQRAAIRKVLNAQETPKPPLSTSAPA